MLGDYSRVYHSDTAFTWLVLDLTAGSSEPFVAVIQFFRDKGQRSRVIAY